MYLFGIDIGGTSIKCGLFDRDGNVFEKWEIPTNRAERGKYVPAEVSAAILKKMEERELTASQIDGIGLGIPGPVNAQGLVLECPNLGWGRLDIGAVMTEQTGLPVFAANDANVAALGEMWKGGGRGFSDVVMVTLGTGVGGGIIINGRIHAGAGGSGEIGHMVVNLDETERCGCGNCGHLEQYASATGIVRVGKKLLNQSESDSVLRNQNPLTAKNVFDAAKAGDQIGRATVETFGQYLGIALSHVAAVVDPEVFVIGGGVSKAGEIILTTVEKYYNERIMTCLRGKKFRLAELGNDAGIYGCAKMVLNSIE